MKKKALLVITKADWAGAQRVVYEIAKGISMSSDFEIHVAVGGEGILTEKLREIDVKVHILKYLIHPIRPFTDLCAILELTRLIKANKYSVVHCHSTKAGIVGRISGKISKVPKILYTIHGWWPIIQYEKSLMWNLALSVERVLAYLTDILVMISNTDLNFAKKFKIGNDDKNTVIYNTISKIENQLPEILRNELKLNCDVKIVGNVSRVESPKNPKEFIEIAKFFKNKPVHFVWIGNGKDYEACNELVKQMELSEKVTFLGFRENATEYMKSFDVLLMTSEWEGMPITILEAQSLKIPVVAPNVGGIEELIGKFAYNSRAEGVSLLERMIDDPQNPEISHKQSMILEYLDLYNK